MTSSWSTTRNRFSLTCKKNSHLDGVLHEKLVKLLNPLAGPEKPEENLVRQEKNVSAELRFVTTVTTGGRVKFVPAV